MLSFPRVVYNKYQLYGWVHNYHPDFFIFGHTYETRDWVPRLSARLDAPFLSDCIGMNLEGSITFTRALYQNKINVDLSGGSTSSIVSFQSGAYKIDALKEGAAEIESVSVNLNSDISVILV